MKNYYKKWKSFALLCFLFITTIGSVRAQLVNTYSFSQSSGAYTAITGGTTILAGLTDDSSSPLANIGFTFTYNGVAHTQFAVNSNGYLTLGGIPSGTYNPISTPSANSIAFAGRDGRTNQAVQYVLTGAAPNRILTIQFVQDLTWSSSANNLQAQVKLYETSNVVQIVYGATARTTTYTMQVGLVGATNTVFSNRTTTTNWAASAGGAANASTMSWSTTVFPASGQTYTWTPPPATPPTPTQAAGTPSCATGTTIDLAGPSPSGVTWYWQTSATGTSTANAYTAPLTIFANGTYFARAYNAAANLWSIASSSIVVSNFPVATAPPAPVALVNPSCAPAGTTISVAAAPAGATYYWQGTNAGGSSNANNASTPLAVTSTGTYYVAAFEAATGCWSNTTGTLVTVNTVIPAAPVVAQTVYNVCSGTPSIPLAATVPIALSAATCNASASASGNDNAATTATVNNFSCASGTIVGATLNASIGGQCPAWYYYSIVVNGVTVATNQCNQNGFNLTPYLPLTSVSIVSFNNPSDSQDFVTMNLTVVLSYLAPTVPQPAYALTWYNTATAGTQLGSGSPLEAVGSSVMPTPTLGSYNFYVETGLAGCVSTRQLVNVNVVDVNVALTPVQESCTNYSNGSFTLGTVTCGTAPFTYSTDGGVTFGAIPNNLTAGTYSVIVRDANNLVSGPISVVITTQSSVVPPAAIVTATDYNYCVGVATAPISAAVPVQLVNGTCSATASASGTDGSGVTATVNNFTCALGTITAATMNASIGTFCTSWYSYSIKVNGITIATNQCNLNNFDLTPYLPISSVQIISANNDGFGDFVTMSLTVNVTYSGPSSPQPAYSLAWFDASTGGNQVGSGSPFETVGTSVMPAAVLGAYDFYVATALGGCLSVDRGQVTVNIVNVNAALSPINATCNGGDNGSFVLGAVACGTLPFTYSVNGGTPGAIPTNLTAGTYTIVITDAAGLTSGPITVVVTQPAPPADLVFIDANYFVADISWTTTGNETSWNVEFGPVGFTPGTGTSQIATASPYTITGLDAETVYEVYVTAICGPNAELSDALLVTTNTGFFTFDNSCGPGFQDISGSGTGLNLADDQSTVITLASPVNFQGNSSSSITVSNNGFISFPGVTLNAWNNDWDSEEGNVFWQETTIAGDDYLIVEWYNRPRFPGIIGQNVTFEILMNKTTNEVYYIYDDVVVGGSQASNDFGGQGTISATGPQGTATVSVSNTAYLTANSCVHFYNALCPNPINLTSQIFQEEVILDWGTGLYGETEWTVIYGPAGFDPATGGTTVTSANSDIDIVNLTQLTEYDVYIYSECTLDDLTSPGLLLNFQTLPFCSDPTGITTATDVDSLFSAWNWVETGPLYPSTGFNIQYGMTGFDLYSGTVVNANNNLSDTTVNAGFLAGGVYQVYVQAVCSSDTSNYAGPFTFIMPLSNDSVCGAEMLAVDGTVYYFNNVGATAQAGEAALITGSNPAGYNSTDLAVMTWGSPAVEGSNWYSFVAPTSGSMRFSGLDQNAFFSQIAVYSLTDCGDFTTFELMGASDQTDAGVTTKLAPNFTLCGLTAGQTYYVLHDAWSNGFGGAANFGQYSIKMTPIDLEAGSFVSMLEVCTGNAVVLFDGITGYQDGGTWTAELASVGTGIADSLFSSSGLSYQVHNFEYRVTDGCAYDSITSQVRIFPPSAAGPDGTLTVCRNEPYDLLSGLSGTVDLGGTWLNPSSVALPGSTTTASNLPGQYNFVYITGNGVCPDDTANVLVDVLTTCDWGNVDEMYFGTMTLLPNPTNGLVYITNQGSTEVFNYEITDIDGRIVATKKSAINGTSVTEINLNGKVTGMYMIRVFNDNAEKVFRVILQ